MDSAYDYLEDRGELQKAAQHKYTHKRRIGTDSRGRPKWRYYYNRRHGGGIGLRALEVQKGEAFGLTYGGKRGHFHVQKVKGNFVTVRHDESGHTVRMTKKELQALIISQRKEKQTVKKKPAEKQGNNFETMPEQEPTRRSEFVDLEIPEWERLARALSLIHISEPTRPY